MTRVDVSQTQDSTRKQRREQARARRRAADAAAVAKAVRRIRLERLGIVSTAIVFGIAVVLIASAGGTAVRRTAPDSGAARQVSREVTALLAGIPQAGDALGRPKAPVTLQYFGDLECPVCRSFALGALPTIIQKWVRTGQLRIEYRALQTATREPGVFGAQQVAALAAGKQNRMWNFVDVFYHEQQEEDTGYVTESYIQGIAQQVPGLNLALWTGARDDPSLASQLSSDAQEANSRRLGGTPAFLLGRSGAATSRLEPSSFTEAAAFNEPIEKLIALTGTGR